MHAHFRRLVLLAGCAAFALAVQAQGTDPEDAMATPRSASAPSPAAPTGTNVVTLTNSNVLGADSGRHTFAKLDTQRKGYLTRGDVAADRYLSNHFSDCDKNADAQLSRAEVEACLRGQTGR